MAKNKKFYLIMVLTFGIIIFIIGLALIPIAHLQNEKDKEVVGFHLAFFQV